MSQLSLNGIKSEAEQSQEIYSLLVEGPLKDRKFDILNTINEKLDDLCSLKSSEESNNNSDLDTILKNYYDYNTGSKILKNRDSYITYLFNNQNFSTIYNIFISGLFLSICNNLFKCFVNPEKRDIPLAENILDFLRDAPLLLTTMCKQICFMCLIYPLFFQFYKLKPFLNLYLFYAVWIQILALFVGTFLWTSITSIGYFDDSMIPTMAITCEQIRLLMKLWAFLRENVKKAIKYHASSETNCVGCPSFSQFLYFLFCPTLVYRDNYPKRKSVDWMFVTLNFMGATMCVATIIIILEHFFRPAFGDFGLVKFSYMKFFAIILDLVLPSTLFMGCVFFGFLHCWLNAWAEMLQFGDRMFYQDWWNSNSYAEYYKKWNIIVHDWLRSYIFNDIKRRLNPKISGIVGSFVVINVSAVIHEYIMVMVIKSFCPGFLIQFGVLGLIVKFVRPSNANGRTLNHWNIYLWVSFMLGNTILLSFYFAEWFAVRNCPLPPGVSGLDRIIPRFISAQCQK